jgi:hypothetical protein
MNINIIFVVSNRNLIVVLMPEPMLVYMSVYLFVGKYVLIYILLSPNPSKGSREISDIPPRHLNFTIMT